MVRNNRLIVALLFCLSAIPLAAQQQAVPDDLKLSLVQKYGFSFYQECRLTVDLSKGKRAAEVQCTSRRESLSWKGDLSEGDAQRLTDFLTRVSLFEGDQGTGVDERFRDRDLDTLEVQSAGKSVVVVTSGNPTFARNAPNPSREQLVSFLKGFINQHSRLR